MQHVVSQLVLYFVQLCDIEKEISNVASFTSFSLNFLVAFLVALQRKRILWRLFGCLSVLIKDKALLLQHLGVHDDYDLAPSIHLIFGRLTSCWLYELLCSNVGGMLRRYIGARLDFQKSQLASVTWIAYDFGNPFAIATM